MTIWFYSDPHFDHAKLVDGTFLTEQGTPARSFASVTEMNETMVERHNAVVKPSDHVYCLGDFAIKKEAVATWAPRLHGHKRLILGNHDIYEAQFYLKYFEKVMAYRVLDGLAFSHIPLAPWSIRSARANVHGHCHLAKPLFYEVPNPDEKGFVKAVKYIHLSVERINYAPVSLEQLQTWSRA
jgi:calcineurin-like phosphoesterase family protein